MFRNGRVFNAHSRRTEPSINESSGSRVQFSYYMFSHMCRKRLCQKLEKHVSLFCGVCGALRANRRGNTKVSSLHYFNIHYIICVCVLYTCGTINVEFINNLSIL